MRVIAAAASAALLLFTSAAAQDEGAHEPQYHADFGDGGIAGAASMGSINDTASPDLRQLVEERKHANEPVRLTDWAKQHGNDAKWGYTIYRTHYPEGDDDLAQWNTVFETLQQIVRSALTESAEYDGANHDPDFVRDRVAFDIVSDEPNLAGASYEGVRAHFQQWVRAEYNASNKMGGFDDGGYLKFHFGDEPRDGMALNQALVIDEGAFASLLEYDPAREVYDFDAGEAPPYVVAVDACFDPATFRQSTSWTSEYKGWYFVPVELLMLDFYQDTYEARPMENFAPRAEAPINMFGVSFENGIPVSEEQLVAEAESFKAQFEDMKRQASAGVTE